MLTIYNLQLSGDDIRWSVYRGMGQLPRVIVIGLVFVSNNVLAAEEGKGAFPADMEGVLANEAREYKKAAIDERLKESDFVLMRRYARIKGNTVSGCGLWCDGDDDTVVEPSPVGY